MSSYPCPVCGNAMAQPPNGGEPRKVARRYWRSTDWLFDVPELRRSHDAYVAALNAHPPKSTEKGQS